MVLAMDTCRDGAGTCDLLVSSLNKGYYMGQIAIVLALLMALLPRPAEAGLNIETLQVKALSTIRNGSHTDPYIIVSKPLTNSEPYSLPFTLTAIAEYDDSPIQRGIGTAVQDKGGYFANRTRYNKPVFDIPYLGMLVEASTLYTIVVSTDQPDTPLILNFNFLGSSAGGRAYYGAGEMSSIAYAHIHADRLVSPNDAVFLPINQHAEMWSVKDEVRLASGLGGFFVHSQTTYDRNNIGLPDAHSPSPSFNGFESTGDMTRGAFAGTLDFGLLQPGEYFGLSYTAGASVYGLIDHAGSGYADIVDPFSLGVPPPPLLALQGLTLPTAAVPELEAYTLMLAGLGLVGLVARRRMHPAARI